MPLLRPSALLLAILALSGCEIPGLGPDPRIAQREADAKAIGAACRHALRGIEDCYTLNERASKTAVFEGWKEMDQYMRENKLEGSSPKLARSGNEIIIEESASHGPVAAQPAARPSADARPRSSDVAMASQRPAGGGNAARPAPAAAPPVTRQ